MPFAINSLTLRTFEPNNRKICTPEIKNTPEINKHLLKTIAFPCKQTIMKHDMN